MTGLVGDSLSAPPPGSTTTGDLYIDLQSRTMWMGVDDAVDPSGAVLLSDIMSIQPSIDSTLTTAKAYTDTQVATRALKVHTHLSTDITDFDNAVIEAIGSSPTGGGLFPGFVGMYSGPMANIGVGIYAGWALCDGTNGTPDMRDRFVLGAGNRASGIVNTLTTATTDVIPAHKHNILTHVITVAELPSHTHTLSASGSGSGSGGTDVQGWHGHGVSDPGHAHNVPSRSGTGSSAGIAYTGNASQSVVNIGSAAAGTGISIAGDGNHSHNVSVNVNVSVSGTTSAVGSNTGHNHEEDLAGAHSHTTSQAQLREAMPYLTLAFIMKLP